MKRQALAGKLKNPLRTHQSKLPHNERNFLSSCFPRYVKSTLWAPLQELCMHAQVGSLVVPKVDLQTV